MFDSSEILTAHKTPVMVVDDPVLVFGGVYSNLEALEALLAEAERRGIPPARMVCTGDVVAYGANPAECVALIRKYEIATVLGNCEEQLALEAEDCGCGFAPGSVCERLSNAWFAYASARIDRDARLWMARLPRRIDLIIGGSRLAVVHGAPSRINRFLFRSHPEEWFVRELELLKAEGVIGVIGGHSGLGFSRSVGGRLWHNAGAIGLPANDGTPRTWFSILSPCPERARGLMIAHLPLAYDHQRAAQAMRKAGLPEGYADALESGIWPSFDVLPRAEQAATGVPLSASGFRWPDDPAPALPAAPEPVASVALESLETLWFNTGTLCNIACTGCYIESSPRNDRLAYLSFSEFLRLLEEAEAAHPELLEIGFTGGEPFLNPHALSMIEHALARGHRVLVLTNAMRPMQRHQKTLRRLRGLYGVRLAMRVSLDHYTAEGHERVRGAGTWAPALRGLRWLCAEGFAPAVAARFNPEIEDEAALRAGFARLFAAEGFAIDAADPRALVLFPELAEPAEVQSVPASAWHAMHPRGRDTMCRTSRMVVQRKGSARASVVACTLLPYDSRFDLGETLAEAARPVALAHPHCARFCVFGGASCASVR